MLSSLFPGEESPSRKLQQTSVLRGVPVSGGPSLRLVPLAAKVARGLFLAGSRFQNSVARQITCCRAAAIHAGDPGALTASRTKIHCVARVHSRRCSQPRQGPESFDPDHCGLPARGCARGWEGQVCGIGRMGPSCHSALTFDRVLQDSGDRRKVPPRER